LNYNVYIGVCKENFNLCRIIKVRFPINHFTCSQYKNRIIIEVTEGAAMVFFYRIKEKRRVSSLTIRKAETLWTSLSARSQQVGIADLTAFFDCISLKVPSFNLAFAK
jgi:hypothetical protein